MAAGVSMLGLIVLPIFILLTYVPGRLILAPLKNAALDPRPRVQFRMAEILLLTAQIGVLGALLMGGTQSAEAFFLFVFATLCLLTWWLAGVRWMSHAGVSVPSARFWTLAVAVPLAFGLIPTLFMLLGTSFAMIENNTTTFGIFNWQFKVSNETAKTVFFTIRVVTLTLLIGHIPLCRWLAGRALRTRGQATA